MSSDISDMSFEISSLHAAYADGATPQAIVAEVYQRIKACLLYTSPSPRDATLSRMPSSA